MEDLGEDVNEWLSGQKTKDTNITDSDTFADEVKINLHMLRVLMLHKIGGELGHANIVAVDESDTREGYGAPRETDRAKKPHQCCWPLATT